MESVEKGILVRYVVKGAPAERFGIQDGDIIVSVNGISLGDGSQYELNSILNDPDPYLLRIHRMGVEHAITIKPILREEVLPMKD